MDAKNNSFPDLFDYLVGNKHFVENLLVLPPAGILILNNQGVILYENPEFKRIMGLDPEHESMVEGLNIKEMPTIIKAGLLPFVEELLNGKSFTNETISYTSLLGKETVMSVNTSSIRGENGQPEFFIIFVCDITLQARTIKDFEENQRQFMSLVESAPIGIVLYELRNNDLYLTDANSAAGEILGLSLPGFKGKTMPEIFPSIISHNHYQKYIEVAREGIQLKHDNFRYQDDRLNAVFDVRAFQPGPYRLIIIFVDITERMQADETIHITQHSVENSSIASFIIKSDGNLIYANKQACNNLGYNSSELLNMSVFDIDPNTSPEKWERFINQLKEGTEGKINSVQKRKNGTIFHTLLTASYFRYNEKEFVFAYVEDITERLKAEEAIKESEEKYRSIFEHFVDLYYQTDMSGVLINLSPSTKELSGYDPAELLGRSVTDVYQNPEDRNRLMHLLLKNKKVEDYELKLVRKDGTVRDVSLNSAIRFDNNGNPVSIEGVIRDHTERKKQERIVRKSLKQQQLLSEVSLKLNSLNEIGRNINEALELIGQHTDVSRVYIFEDNPDKITTTNTCEWCNVNISPQINELQNISYDDLPSLREYFKTKGYMLAEDIHELPGDMVAILEPQEIKSIQIFPLYVAGNQFGFIGFDECLHRRHWEATEIELLKTITHLFANFFERKLAEDQLIIEKERAEESDRLKSAFLTTMSHELRTPLNAIIGFSELIDDETEKDDLVSYVQTINQSGKHLLNIIEDVFELSSLETGNVVLDITEFPMNEFAQEIKDIFIVEKHNFEKEEIRYIYKPDTSDFNPLIKTDRKKLKNLAGNLVKNAVKFTDSGTVEFGFVFNENGSLTFYIKDTGIGIHMKYKEVIFERFRQIDDTHTREYGGTGLGLTIARKLAGLLHIDLDLTSELGKGSTFYFTLPPDSFVRKKPGAREAYWEKTETTDFTGNTILIVEDEYSNFLFLKTVLKRLGAMTFHAGNGNIAIEFIKRNPEIALVLMDIKMPEMNGYEATRIIKKMRPGLPVIAQTAYALPGDREKALEAGCDAYIEKPIKTNVLLNSIKELLNKKE